RNGTMYASYTAASFARKYELADHHGINLFGAVTWGFEFENQPWFAGFRDMATNGADKPVLNVFRMFGIMEGNRVEVNQNNLAYNYLKVRDESVRGVNPDINAIASKGKNTATVMVWNYHDNNDLDVPASPVEIKLEGIPAGKVLLNHYRIDQKFSNSYTVWKKMGSPQNPGPEQIAELEKAGQLQLFTSPEWVKIVDGKAIIKMELPRQGVSLMQLLW
ncbi:MAG: beta-xylosidase, partial [Bacteroidota bacterium]|nr:beta-xylosidase [Bacteroidota bacterium]